MEPFNRLRTWVSPLIEFWDQQANFLVRSMKPLFKRIGLPWVDSLVLRRSCASLLTQTGTDPKVVADQLGHDLGASLDVYTKTSQSQRATAVNRLEDAIFAMKANA